MKQILAITSLLFATLVGLLVLTPVHVDYPQLEENIAFGAANQATVEVLGGGGGGGIVNASAGGGGVGGEFRAATCTLAVAAYTVTVGAGGTIDTTGETDSTFTGGSITITADGGNGTSNANAGSAGTGGSTTGCTSIVANDGGTPGAGDSGEDSGGGGGGGAGWGGKGGNGAAATATQGGGGGGGAGESAAGGNASGVTQGTGGTGGGGNGGNSTTGDAAGSPGTGGTPATWHIVGGGGGGGSGGPTARAGGACGAPGAGSGGGEATGAGNGCRGEIRITYVDSQIDATGGTETTSGIYRTHTFTSSGTFTVNSGQASPYVVMDNPTSGTTTTDTTPTLYFTGTASTSDDIRYNVQVHTSDAFGTTLDSYSESNVTTGQGVTLGGSYKGVGQSFNAGAGGTLFEVTFNLYKVGSPTGSAYAKIYNATGTPGVNATPTGAALATSDAFDVSGLLTTYANRANYTFNFTGANQISLTASANYIVTFEYDGGDASNYPVVNYDGSASGDGGNSSGEQVSDSLWVDLNLVTYYGFAFYVKTGPLIDATSTMAGFSGSPDSTDPFTSGQQVNYTVQSALSDGTYYWRVRGIDPSGTNAYGSYATPTRTFIVSSGAPPATINYQSEFFMQ